MGGRLPTDPEEDSLARSCQSAEGLAAFALLCLALAGCGGSNSGADVEAGETGDPREGYFHETESDALNPPIGKLQAAWTAYTKNADPCDRRAQQLFAQGASPRKSVQCHLRANQALLDATTGIQTAVAGLDGDYRTQCDAQIQAFTAALERLEAARQKVLEHWNAYATSGEVAADIQEDVTAADDASQELLEDEVQSLSDACYTEADRAAAENE